MTLAAFLDEQLDAIKGYTIPEIAVVTLAALMISDPPIPSPFPQPDPPIPNPPIPDPPIPPLPPNPIP